MYFLGVRIRLIKVSFKANTGNKFWDLATVRLIEGVHFIWCRLNTGFTVPWLPELQQRGVKCRENKWRTQVIHPRYFANRS